MTTIEQSAAWQALVAHRKAQQAVPLRHLFNEDKTRFEKFSITLPSTDSSVGSGLLLDYSKTALTDETVNLLEALVQVADLSAWRDAMFAGDVINMSEKQAVLHTSLRASADDDIWCGEENITAAVLAEQEKMLTYADDCRQGRQTTAAGSAFTDVINIGIGGSDLGPAMTVAGLSPDHDGARLHFVSNMDGAHLADILATTDARRTLVIVSSKTFTTAETISNARLARDWLRAAVGDKGVCQHLIGVTAAPQQAHEFGIQRVFSYWEWVGGRYSIWGAVGLPLALAIGREKFNEFLAGGREMDAHFRHAPFRQNIPLMLGLIGVWHRNICSYPTRVVLPYEQRLHLLPAYLQQLDMESNGKQVTKSGEPVGMATAPVVWGTVGTNAQHAYFQMLHQGTDIVPCEFIVAACGRASDAEQHRQLLANCLAQSAALMSGGSDSAKLPHCHFAGNRPSITLLYKQLSPYTLGQLIALYEHRTFVEGAIWGVNTFDQWGVELGKTLADELTAYINGDMELANDTDSSTQGLLRHYRQLTDGK